MTVPVIVAARRSAVVPRGGGFAHLAPHEIAAPVLRACLADAGLEPGQVDELILGNALGAGGNPARLVALAAELPETVGGLSIDRQCCSGLDALILADALIRSGRARVVIAGGTESYSRRPLRARTFADGRPPEPYDQAPFTPWPDRDPDMALSADRLAHRLGIGRSEQDAWARASHSKAVAAAHPLQREIVPLSGVAHDPFARNLNVRLCARASPVSGTITAANMAVAADGAAFCIVVDQALAGRLDGPQARLERGATLGGQPDLPGLAPVQAIRAVLGQAGLAPDALDVAEIMEAFAVQAIACVQGAGIDPEIVNPGGGALARGHPVGASGAVNAVRLFQELAARGGGQGVAAIAAAGGLGTAVLLKA